MARSITPVSGLSVKQHQWLRNRWAGMHDRCRPGAKCAANYIMRGIRVCDEWADFDAFARHVVEAVGVPDIESATRWTLDRIDNDRGYEPGNIRWATYAENLRNRRGNVFVTFEGRQVTIGDLADRFGLSYYLLHDRIQRQGWTAEEAVASPISKTQRLRRPVWKHELRIEHDGQTRRLCEWAAHFGIDAALLRARLARGWAFLDAVSSPADKGRASKARAQRVPYQGRMLTWAELSTETGIGVATLRYRVLKMGLSPEQAIAPAYRAGTTHGSAKKTDILANERAAPPR